MKKIKVTPDNLKELSENVEVLEVLEYGVKILTSKNGVVMREEVASWENEVWIDNGVINIQWITKAKEEIDNFVKEIVETQPIAEEIAVDIANLAGREKKATKGKKTTKKKSE